MNNNKEVVLDGTGLIKLAGGMFLLIIFGFTAGAVLGFGYRDAASPVAPVGSAAPTAPAAPAPPAAAAAAAPPTTATVPPGAPTEVSAAAATARCVPVEPLPPTVASTVIAASKEPPHRETRFAEGVPGQARYVVQLGVFGVEANADRLAADLRRRGYDPLVGAMRARSGQWLKRVSLAVYDSEADADRAASAFSDREGLPAVVVAFNEEGR